MYQAYTRVWRLAVWVRLTSTVQQYDYRHIPNRAIFETTQAETLQTAYINTFVSIRSDLLSTKFLTSFGSYKWLYPPHCIVLTFFPRSTFILLLLPCSTLSTVRCACLQLRISSHRPHSVFVGYFIPALARHRANTLGLAEIPFKLMANVHCCTCTFFLWYAIRLLGVLKVFANSWLLALYCRLTPMLFGRARRARGRDPNENSGCTTSEPTFIVNTSTTSGRK